MLGDVVSIVNQAVQSLNQLASSLVESAKTFEQANGIYATLKQNEILGFTVPYIVSILYSLKHKEKLDGNVAKDAATVIQCLEKYDNGSVL
jgi:hypothetical protein